MGDDAKDIIAALAFAAVGLLISSWYHPQSDYSGIGEERLFRPE